MFDFAWSEMIVVAIVGLLILGPEELPTIVRSVRKGINKLKTMASDFSSSVLDDEHMTDLKGEARKINEDIKTIIDLEGNIQPTYDISDIVDDTKKKDK